MFKLALLQRRYDAVIAMIKSGGLCGTAIISYLQQKGFPEVGGVGGCALACVCRCVCVCACARV